MVDMINAELVAGNLPLHSCYCTDEMRNDVTHFCGGCGKETPCLELSKNLWGISMCKPCHSKSHKPATGALNEHLIRVGLRARLQAEAAFLGHGLDDTLVQEVYEEGVASITRNMGDCAGSE